jgi:hypothetical protein
MSTEYKVIREFPDAAGLARQAIGAWSADSSNSSPYAAQVPVTEASTPITRALGLLLRLVPYYLVALVLAWVALVADWGMVAALLVAVGVTLWGWWRIEQGDRADSPIALERDRLDAATEVQLARLQHERDLRQMALEAALYQMGVTNGEQYTVISGKQLSGVAAHGGASQGRKQLPAQDYKEDGAIYNGAYRQDFEVGAR